MGKGVAHALVELGARTPLHVERKGVACLSVVGMCVVAFWRETAAVEADETDVDAERVVLGRG